MSLKASPYDFFFLIIRDIFKNQLVNFHLKFFKYNLYEIPWFFVIVFENSNGNFHFYNSKRKCCPLS